MNWHETLRLNVRIFWQAVLIILHCTTRGSMTSVCVCVLQAPRKWSTYICCRWPWPISYAAYWWYRCPSTRLWFSSGCTVTWYAVWSATSRSLCGVSLCSPSCGSAWIATWRYGNPFATRLCRRRFAASAGWHSRGSRRPCCVVPRSSVSTTRCSTGTRTSACLTGGTWPRTPWQWPS